MNAAHSISAVVFDLDGVIVDSEGVWDDVRRELASDAGRAWPASATTDMMGMSSLEWSAYMRDQIGIPSSAADINHEVVRRIVRHYERGLPLIAGAVAAVRRLVRRFPLALASSSNREVIDAVLETSDLGRSFEETVSSEEVGVGKPAPDVYVEASRRLGVDASRCVAIEDSANGIRSAVSAGMRAVAIPNSEFPPPPSVLATATVVLPTIAWLWPATIDRAGATP